MDYTGRIITKNPQTPSANSAPGIWSLDEAMQYSKQGKWPPGYQISRSVRLRSSASAYFSRTPSSAGNRRTFTLSFWIKSGSLAAGTTGQIMGTNVGTYDRINFGENSTAQLSFTVDAAGTAKQCFTPGVYRDPSAWYHFVVAVDTTQATDTNRVKIYANGVQQTLTGTFPTQNYQSSINNNVAQYLGSDRGSTYLYDGYMTEINFVDGQQLTPASFGYNDTYTGVWQPAPYTGTYGTNGFYLTFADNSAATATTIGKDYSGNGNNWTPNNISVTAGTTYDSMVDVPINWGTDTGAGGTARGNYAVWNPLNLSQNGGTAVTLTNGNLTASFTAANYGYAYTTMHGAAISQSKIGCEFYIDAIGAFSYGVQIICSGTNVRTDGATGTNTVTFTTGDYIQVVYTTASSGTCTFYKNGTQIWQATSVGGFVFPSVALQGSGASVSANFGQKAWQYSAPFSSAASLCTQNLPTPSISNGANYMAATLWTGTGVGSRAITNTSNGVSFQPDWVWIKSRSATYSHQTNDSVRGATNGCLYTDLTNAVDANFGITSFNSDGFTLGNTASLISSSFASQNGSGATFVGWQWKGGGTGVTNTSGSITSTVSANTTAGFSVVTWTGTGANATVGHGLGVAPSMIIVKGRFASNWSVYHASLSGNTYYLILNSTAAQSNTSGTTYWNSTSPTSTVFSLGTDANVNSTNAAGMVAYCFAPISGYSAFGSYTGNGTTDGPFVYCGFRPRFILIKATNLAADWSLWDTSRSPYNQGNQTLWANLSNVEYTAGEYFDVLSNGFKLRDGNTESNGAYTYIYAAFAENPFTIARAR
jgi:hypothetical protein